MKLYYYTAPWCMPCRQKKPAARKVAAQMGAEFIEVNVDEPGAYIPSWVLGVPAVEIVDDKRARVIAQLSPDMVTAATIRKALA